MYRYGGVISVAPYQRCTNKVPTLEEMQKLKQGMIVGNSLQEEKDLLLNYIQRLEDMLDGHAEE